MFLIIPFLVFVFIFLISYMKLSEHEDLPVWRVSFLSASIVWGVLVVVITEILSVFDLLTFKGLVGFWIAIGILSAFFCCLLVIQKKPSFHFNLPKFQPLELLLLSGVVFIVMVLCVIGLIAPPNTWDSMTYHMSRVSHWIQNHNVAHYPTSIIRQLYLQPGAEFMIMHFQILGGNDRFANSIQWVSMLGSLIGVSLIAMQLGASLSGQLFAVVICSTIPGGILQASSTQNEYVVTFWLICFVYFLMLLRTESRRIFSFATGASLGLALLTKATAYIYAFPFFLWFVFSGFKRYQWKGWKVILTIAIIAIFINLGHYIRNFDLFGYPLGGSKELTISTNSAISLPLLTSNIIRNIGLHLGTPLWLVNLALYKAINTVHTILGVSINDSRITFGSHKFTIPFSLYENTAGNLLHLMLIFASITIFFISSQRKERQDLMIYCITVMAAFVLFALSLRWQVWGSRLHLPIFALWAPFVARVMARVNHSLKRKELAIILCIMFAVVVGGCLLHDYLTDAMSKGVQFDFLNPITGKDY